MATNLNSQFCTQMATKVILEKIEEETSNIVLSPLSFQLMLSLVAAGSTGLTLKQILSHLGSPSVDHLNILSSNILSNLSSNPPTVSNNPFPSPLLYIANRLWVQETCGVKPSFQSIAKEFYRAKAKEVDFAKGDQVVNEVNSWIEDATEGQIKNLIPSGTFTSDTILVFTNAIYFKGEWTRTFDKNRTTNKDFHLLNGQIIPAPFMTSALFETHYLYAYFDDYKILKIPYKSSKKNTNFSMYFFLPNEIDGLPKLLHKINSDPGFLNQDFRLWEADLSSFWIPKFKFSFEFRAKDTLIQMGMNYPFDTMQELIEMVDDLKLCVEEVFHKSCIEVNEQGTEAAAATAVVFIPQRSRTNPPSFVADHPFMFMIREENSGTILFVGAVLNPLLGDN